MSKYVCIHGHFYQPPRENAWLEYIEAQESARPFHDWNERINFECYAPNTSARILDDQGRIKKIINNYEWISFNFGPTLLSWMEQHDAATYRVILEADRKGAEHFGGHGPAIAQAYSHMILPLANRRDKETQIQWGIMDFESRFGRKPEGMWLPETAVDSETLAILAEKGIRFTILAPRQAKAFKKIGDSGWITTQAIDPHRPYLYRVPGSDKTIALFFYDGDLAQEVAFNGLLHDGKRFAERLSASIAGQGHQLSHIATDGETYGHHHRYGEMALARALDILNERTDVTLTNYGQYLELFPPEYEVQIHENSSWSCVHGVERWCNDCGCNTGGHPDWNQLWRKPLRETLDEVRDQLIKIFDEEGSPLFKDPWEARNAYYQVIKDRSESNIKAFLRQHCKTECEETAKPLRLLEMQRHAMLMYTSCGWFFDEVTGLETSQILQYAGRAIQYAEKITGKNLQEAFVRRLEEIPSNIYENGAHVYVNHLMPNIIGFERVAMHYAATGIFELPKLPDSLLAYQIIKEENERFEAGIQKLNVGKISIRSRIILAEKTFHFAVLYLGQQNIVGALMESMPEEKFEEMKAKLVEAFRRPSIGQVFAIMNNYFNGKRFSIWELFTDEKQRILNRMLENGMEKASDNLEEIYESNYQLMLALKNEKMHIPEAFLAAAEFVINGRLQAELHKSSPKADNFRKLVAEIKNWNIRLVNTPQLELAASELVFSEIKKITLSHASQIQMNNLLEIVSLLEEIEIRPNLWKSQNAYFRILQGLKARNWDYHSEEWKKSFILLGRYLKVAVGG